MMNKNIEKSDGIKMKMLKSKNETFKKLQK